AWPPAPRAANRCPGRWCAGGRASSGPAWPASPKAMAKGTSRRHPREVARERGIHGGATAAEDVAAPGEAVDVLEFQALQPRLHRAHVAAAHRHVVGEAVDEAHL